MPEVQRKQILVTVKTYPTLSKKYGETVCTAGICEDGSWIRLYPVPFRRLEEEEQYKKFDWLDCRVTRQTSDPRPESYRPDWADLQRVGHIGTEDKWQERRRIVLDNGHVYTRLDEIIAAAKSNQMSLCVFKPKEILACVVEREEREWNPKKIAQMRGFYSQTDMFEDNEWRKNFQIVDKMPYSFSYRFVDAVGKESEMQILDWEICQLYWNCLRTSGGDERVAVAKVRQKYINDLLKTDLHLFLGTTQRFHSVGVNPWVIVGVFPVPRDERMRMI